MTTRIKVPVVEEIPTYLTTDCHPVLAWLPTNNTLEEYVTVCRRMDAEFVSAPYVAWRVRPVAGYPATSPRGWELDLGVFDIKDLHAAVRIALEMASYAADKPSDRATVADLVLARWILASSKERQEVRAVHPELALALDRLETGPDLP